MTPEQKRQVDAYDKRRQRELAWRDWPFYLFGLPLILLAGLLFGWSGGAIVGLISWEVFSS